VQIFKKARSQLGSECPSSYSILKASITSHKFIIPDFGMCKWGMHVQKLLFISFASLRTVDNRALEGISILVNRLGANNPAGIALQREFVTKHSNIGIDILLMGIWSCSGGEHVHTAWHPTD
jgi:hypothetical protein